MKEHVESTEAIPIEEWGERTGLKQALETHLEYGDDFVRLALITFRQYLQEHKMKEYHITGFVRKWVNETVNAENENDAIKKAVPDLSDDFEAMDLEVTECQYTAGPKAVQDNT